MSFDPWELLARIRPDVVNDLRRWQGVVGRQLSPRERVLVRVALAAQSRSVPLLESALDEAAAYEIEPDALLDAVLCAGPIAGMASVLDAVEVIHRRHPELVPDDTSEETPLVVFSPSPPEIPPTDDLPAPPAVRSLELLVEEVPETGAKVIELSGRRVAVFRAEERFYAVDDVCPHQDRPLADGQVEDGHLVCPWHGWRFDLGTGQCDLSPGEDLVIHRAEVRGDRLLVSLADSAEAE